MIWIVVMGVSGCGKSYVGELVAKGLGLPLIEGDEFHPESNRERMRAGIALTDADRAGWLDTLGLQLQAHPGGAVLTCSSLKAAYRDRLRAAMPGLRFAWLELDPVAAQARVAQRGAHFFPAGLVATQFAALEPPVGEPGVLRLDAMQPPQAIADEVVRWCAQAGGPAPEA